MFKSIFTGIRKYGIFTSIKVFYLNICRKKQFFLNISFLRLYSPILLQLIPKIFSPIYKIENDRIIRTVLSFKGIEISKDPFINLVKEINQKNIKDYETSFIKKYYDKNKVDNIYELYPLTKQIKNSKIFSLKAKYINYILPWNEIFYKKKLSKILSEVDKQKNIFRKSIEYGLKFNKNIFYGNQNFGPVHQDMGRLEFKRYKSVLKSILKFGYKPNTKNSPHLSGQILIKKDKWLVFIADGVHRTTVLLALGYKDLPVSFKVFPKIIKTEDVSIWPGVSRGVYTEKEALIIFDSIFYSKNFLNIK